MQRSESLAEARELAELAQQKATKVRDCIKPSYTIACTQLADLVYGHADAQRIVSRPRKICILQPAAMDPGSIAASALGAAATSVATKGVDKTQEKYGLKGVLTAGAMIIAILSLFQARKTKSFRGILG